MLQAAAERGVQVRIIVFKEVEQALTCKRTPSCNLEMSTGTD